MINNSNITIKSSWGVEVDNRLLFHSSGSKKLVVIFPAQYYRCDAPLLYYNREAALLSGCDVLSINYGFQIANKKFQKDDMSIIVKEAFEAIKMCLKEGYEEIYFVSKSLGTIIAGEVRKMWDNNQVKMIFMTPMSETLTYIKNSHCLIITGSNDMLFDSDCVEIIEGYASAKLKVIEGANHSLEIEDDYKRSLQILNEVIDLCVNFIVSTVD